MQEILSRRSRLGEPLGSEGKCKDAKHLLLIKYLRCEVEQQMQKSYAKVH